MKTSQPTKTYVAAIFAVLASIFFVPIDALGQCNMDFFFASVSSCEGATNTYAISGDIEFSNPPVGGVLTVTVNDGFNTYDTIINPPFVSPQTYSISGIPADGLNVNVSVVFSAEPGCTNGINVNTPEGCDCAALIGSFTADVVGSGQADYSLCFGDQFSITSTGGFVPPEIANNPPGPPYSPGIGYLVYSCLPSVGLTPTALEDVALDPCLLGVVGNGNSFTSDNSIGIPPYAGNFVDNTLYFVPITLYSTTTVPETYSYVNTNIPCYQLGQPYAVQYLPEVVYNAVPDCQTASVTVTVAGGLPAVDGSQFSASNLLPANASFVNATTSNNGTIVIDGLLNGDMYSFDITDDNGCPVTVTGGPFVGVPVADAGADDQTCSLSYQLSPVVSYGTGSWSGGPIGTTFTPNATDPNATVTVPSAGTHTFTWTENNGNGCIDSDEVEISFSNISIPAVITDASCTGGDGQIVVAPQGGVPTYSYSWTTGGNTAVEDNLNAGSTTVTVTDGNGCSLDSTFTITQPQDFNYAINTQDETCFGLCDGQAEIIPDGLGPYTYTWTPNVGNSGNEFALCQGNYQVLIEDQEGCSQTVDFLIGGPTEVLVTLDSDTNLICIGGQAEITSSVNGGTPPYNTYTWSSNPADPSIIANASVQTVSPVVQTQYSLIVNDANGCPSAPVDITIDVLPALTLDVIRPLLSPDTSICPYDFATIDLTAGGGDGNYNIYLLPDDVNPIALPIDTQPTVTTTFDFMVTDGCTTPPAYTSSTVTVFELPEVMIAALPDSGCQPLEVEFVDLTQPAPIAWNWNFGDANSNSNTSPLSSPIHVYEDAGTYDVSLSITTAEGCVTDTVISEFIEVFPLPLANFELTPEVVNLLNARVEFTDLSVGNIVNWDWNFGDGETSSVQNPIHAYQDTGNFSINLVVTTDNGCVDQTFRTLIVEPEFMFYVPNAFTPNSDTRNDGFRGYGEGIDWDTYEMSIFTRWGELIYYTKDINDPWDGSYKGAPVEVSVYVWKIKFVDITGNDHQLYGHVTLVR